MWIIVNVVVLENKFVSLADGAWQSILDCIDRFVAVFHKVVKALADWSLLLMRYHLLSLRLFHSFSIICRTCESIKGSFS